MGKLFDLDGYRVVTTELKKYIDIIDNKANLNGEALLSHTHKVSQIIDFPAVLKNPYSLIIKLNNGSIEGTNMFTYDGGSAKNLNITAAGIGAAPSSHSHNYLPLSGGILTVAAYYGLTIKRSDNNGAAISYQNTGKILGGAGFLSDGSFQISSESNTNGNILKATTTNAVFPGAVSATTFTGNLNGTAATASKLGTATVGGAAKPVYINSGTPTALSASVGAANKPIFLNAGTFTVSNATVGSSSVPVFMNGGTITACSSLSLNTTGSAAKWTTDRILTIGNTGKAVNGSSNVTWTLPEIGAIPLTGATNITGNLEFSNSGTNLRGIVGIMGDSDFWRIAGGATVPDSGYLEIATADTGNEPIYVRQYSSGKFVTLKRTATLLDASGNTTFPGTVTAPSFIGALSGNATSATKASLLSNLYSSRPESADIAITGNGCISAFKATSTMTTGKPPGDSHIIHFEWDNTAGYNAQLAIGTINGNLYTRGMGTGKWGTWNTYLHSANYTSYTVTKTGSGASGTWGISITGNAATATKATQDGSGNTITSKYVALDTAQTISGVKTFSTEQRFNSMNAFRLIRDNYGVLFRNDGSDFYMLLTNSGEATSGNYNSFRPFRITLTTGEVTIGNGLISHGTSKFTNTTDASSATTGAIVVSGGIGVAKQIVTNSKLYVGHTSADNSIIYLNGKRGVAGTDGWLRLNDTSAFTNGVYFGSSVVRTDGTLQVGGNGSSINITTSVVQLKTPTTISNTATITGITSITNTTASTSKTTGALKVSGGIGVAGKVNAASIGVNDTWTIQLGSAGSIDFILN